MRMGSDANMNYTGDIVYSSGNLNVWCPWANMLGRRPAFGIMFQARVSVTFLFFLQSWHKIKTINGKN